jgi:hypothetical protein
MHLEDMIGRGEAKDYADLAWLNCLCRERINQIVRLNYLARDIQVELLYLPPTTSGPYQRNSPAQDCEPSVVGRPAVRMEDSQAKASLGLTAYGILSSKAPRFRPGK